MGNVRKRQVLVVVTLLFVFAWRSASFAQSASATKTQVVMLGTGTPLPDPDRSGQFHLITPYDSDPRTWLAKEWIDQHSKRRFRITTRGHCGSMQTARIKTYGDVVTSYEFHPESKCADGPGNPCERQTTGLLQRRHIKIDLIKCIGKESNSLESVDEGLEHSEKNVYTDYQDPNRTEWIVKIQPAVKKVSLKRPVALCRGRLSRRTLIDHRSGKSKPHTS